MNNFIAIKNYVVSLTTNLIQTPKIEVHQDRDLIYRNKYTDKCFFTNILFLTSISPCET